MKCRSFYRGSLSGIVFAAALGSSVTPSLLYAQGSRTEIIVERKAGKTVQQMSPQHVFSAGDRVRFRFRSTVAGYLYVTDQSTSGKYMVLFPATATGESSEMKADKDYLVPAKAGTWFRVDNPPGYETLFFTVSPTEMKQEARAEEPTSTEPAPLPAAPQSPPPAANLLPRCDDAIFQARGDCNDVTAGPRQVPAGDKIPGAPSSLGDAGSREVTIINKPKSSVIAPSGADAAPFIYEFRLAHK